MTIKFSIRLSAATVKAFEDVDGCEDASAIVELLKEAIKDRIEEATSQFEPDVPEGGG